MPNITRPDAPKASYEILKALRDSEEGYRKLVETSQALVWRCNAKGRFVYLNPAWENTHGYKLEEMLGKPFTDFQTEEVAARDMQEFRRQLRGGLVNDYETTHIAKSGEEIHLIFNPIPWYDAAGRIVGIQGTAYDITAQKKMEEKVAANEKLLRTITENLPNTYLSIIEKDLTVSYTVGRGFLSQNLAPADFVGMTLEEIFGEQASEVKEYYLKTFQGEETVFEVFHNNQYQWYHTVPLEGESGEVSRILVFVLNITERKEAEEQLRRNQEQLRALASDLVLTGEQERRRIAIELHDGVGQALSVVKMKLGALRAFAATSSKAVKVLDEVCVLTDQVIQATRSLTFDLSPPILYELGLEAAIEWLAEQFQERHDIQIAVEDDRQSKPLNNDVRILLFQMVRELLLNAVKHAQGRHAYVFISRRNREIQIEIADDGIGFDHSPVDPGFFKGRSSGFGLFSIRERLNFLGGNFQIESESGHGTRVVVVAPLQDEGEATKESTP